MRISGFNRLISFPILIQLKGLTEFTFRLMIKFFGAGSSENCDLPGTKNWDTEP
jgi:hypothetical protein